MFSDKLHKGKQAFTLIEIVVVLAIVAILVVLAIPNFSKIQLKAEGIVCTGRLRNLWMTFSTQLNDGNGWPQLPTNIPIGTLKEQQWWLDTTSNSMGLSQKDWNCPSIVRTAGSGTNSQQSYLISYLPTLFDASPMAPKIWPRMPWFTEVVGLHGNGNLTIRADGSVCPFQDP